MWVCRWNTMGTWVEDLWSLVVGSGAHYSVGFFKCLKFSIARCKREKEKYTWENIYGTQITMRRATFPCWEWQAPTWVAFPGAPLVSRSRNPLPMAGAKMRWLAGPEHPTDKTQGGISWEWEQRSKAFPNLSFVSEFSKDSLHSISLNVSTLLLLYACCIYLVIFQYQNGHPMYKYSETLCLRTLQSLIIASISLSANA